MDLPFHLQVEVLMQLVVLRIPCQEYITVILEEPYYFQQKEVVRLEPV